MLPLLMLGIEPNLGPFQRWMAPPHEGPHVVGSLVALFVLVLMPAVALMLNLAPIRRAMRTGGTMVAHPMNLLLAIAIVAIISTFIGAIVVDQYPCWMGVPNCD